MASAESHAGRLPQSDSPHVGTFDARTAYEFVIEGDGRPFLEIATEAIQQIVQRAFDRTDIIRIQGARRRTECFDRNARPSIAC